MLLVQTRKWFYLPSWLIASLVLMSAIFCQLTPYPKPGISGQAEVSAIARETQYGWPLPYTRLSHRTLNFIYSPQGIAFDAIASILIVLSVIVATESAIDVYVYRVRIGLRALFVLTFVVAGFFGLFQLKMGTVLFGVPAIVQAIMIFGVGCLNFAVLRSFLVVLKEMD